MGVIGTDEAARRLQLTPGRLSVMIRSGIVVATKVGRTWVIDEVEVERVAKLQRPRGRPKKK